MVEDSEKRWCPLESNPEVFQEYMQKLGFPTNKYGFYDLLALEEWALESIPQPVIAILLIFPITENSEKALMEQEEALKAKGIPELPKSLYYMKQTVGNACGTIGLLHVAGNLDCSLEGWLQEFFALAKPLDPDFRGALLQGDTEIAKKLEQFHEESASEGQSNMTEGSAQHFIAFVQNGANLYELDGRKITAINHGPVPEGARFVDKAFEVIRVEFMEKDPTNLNFGIVAVCPV